MEMDFVFVYGTLRKGFGNYRLLSDAEFIGNAKTKDKYIMYARGIPFVSKNFSQSHIVGEVYKVDKKTLRDLDRLEGHPNWYYREKVPVILEDGKEIEAWIYFNDMENGHTVETGDFVDYYKNKGKF